MLDCCTRAPFWKPFWYALFLHFCIEFYRIEQNEASKSCQNRPSWAGAWGAWVIVVFIRGCSPRPSIKNSKHPSSPNTRPRGPVLTTFWAPIFKLFVELYASSPPTGVPKWPPKRFRCATVWHFGDPPAGHLGRPLRVSGPLGAHACVAIRTMCGSSGPSGRACMIMHAILTRARRRHPRGHGLSPVLRVSTRTVSYSIGQMVS